MGVLALYPMINKAAIFSFFSFELHAPFEYVEQVSWALHLRI